MNTWHDTHPRKNRRVPLDPHEDEQIEDGDYDRQRDWWPMLFSSLLCWGIVVLAVWGLWAVAKWVIA